MSELQASYPPRQTRTRLLAVPRADVLADVPDVGRTYVTTTLVLVVDDDLLAALR